MGVNLYNKEYSMDMGYGSFLQLRNKIAELFNEEFAENYRKLPHCSTNSEYDENCEKANEIIEKYNLDDDIIDFLYQSDCNGRVTYEACKKLYNIIKDYDDDYMYGYVHANHSFSYFKEK